MVRIRAARAGDAAVLSDIAFRSKAHWGYDEEFLERARPELDITPEEIERLRVAVADDGGRPIGFYAVDTTSDPAEVLAMFVEPAMIGTGAGAALFAAAVEAARKDGATTLRIESDPNAAGFYRSRGAVRVGERVSKSTGRSLPLLDLKLR